MKQIKLKKWRKEVPLEMVRMCLLNGLKVKINLDNSLKVMYLERFLESRVVVVSKYTFILIIKFKAAFHLVEKSKYYLADNEL